MEKISGDRKSSGLNIGINGLGRIGKLTLWHHVARKYFDEIIINMGRTVGGSITDLAQYIERDSTYGRLSAYLYGYDHRRRLDDSHRMCQPRGGIRVNRLASHLPPGRRAPSRHRCVSATASSWTGSKQPKPIKRSEYFATTSIM